MAEDTAVAEKKPKTKTAKSAAFQPLTVPQIDQGIDAMAADELVFHLGRLQQMVERINETLKDAKPDDPAGRRGDWKSFEIITACIERIKQRQTVTQ